jgi:hypothetical protein
VARLKRHIREFELLFERESSRVSVFYVPPKGIYDIEGLIERAQNHLPEDVKSRLDAQAIYDIQQAGKCLAYNIPTAAGMHILKAVESLIRKYHAKLTGVTLSPKQRSWGTYIKLLKANNADTQVTEYLTHIKDFYRNPILHPEVTLTPEQAQSLFGAATSAIIQLDAAIEVLP